MDGEKKHHNHTSTAQQLDGFHMSFFLCHFGQLLAHQPLRGVLVKSDESRAQVRVMFVLSHSFVELKRTVNIPIICMGGSTSVVASSNSDSSLADS